MIIKGRKGKGGKGIGLCWDLGLRAPKLKLELRKGRVRETR